MSDSKRKCGMLLPVASLPSRYGIGAFSKEAYEFIDTLKQAGQHYWQILPLGPTGYGDSPYQSFSAFAGNPYFIDLDGLKAEGLLTEEECDREAVDHDLRDIDYGRLYHRRFQILRMAYSRWKAPIQADGGLVSQIINTRLGEESREYCFYMAVKDRFGGKSWIEWEEPIRRREPAAMADYYNMLEDEIGFYGFQQLKFQEQWGRLKDYAHQQGIHIIGDIPIYVAFDSADTWTHPELFQFDEQRHPSAVAGCPPDGFSADGQLWGNPLYCWDYHRETGYEWWMNRIQYCFYMYDVVRIDHFRGFDEYYSIPAKNRTAAGGTWRKGPGIGFFHKIKERFGHLDIIAEDLGFLTPSVIEMVRESGFPGMKVLEFAFDSREKSNYLPYNYTSNCVVYTGTHDNNTVKGWYQSLDPADRRMSVEYMDNCTTKLEDISWDFIRLALSSVADTVIVPVQDYLGLGSEARINTPSTLGCNWRWRMLPGELSAEIACKCRYIASIYGRI